MSVKVALIPRNTNTTVRLRINTLNNIRFFHFLNERNIIPINYKRKDDIIEKDRKVNNYRKVFDTYFDPYD